MDGLDVSASREDFEVAGEVFAAQNSARVNRARALRPRVHAFEFGTEVYHVRPLTARHFDDHMAKLIDGASGDSVSAGVELAARLACYCLCDENGTRWFQDGELDLVRDQVGMDLLSALVEPALDVSGLGGSAGGN